MMKKTSLIVAIVLFMVLNSYLLVGINAQVDGVDQLRQVPESLRAVELDTVIPSLNSSGFTIFAALLGNSNISAALNLSDGEPKTIFAPTDAAIIAFNISSSDLENAQYIIAVLPYHIVPLYLPSTSIISTLGSSNNATNVTTLLGVDYPISVTRNDTGIFVNSNLVSKPDIAKTGKTAVHGIDGVLVPVTPTNSTTPPSTPPPSTPPPSTPPPSTPPPPSPPPPSPPPSMGVRVPRFYAVAVPFFAVFFTSFGILMS